MGVFLLFAVAAAVAVYQVWSREKRKTAETEAQSARALLAVMETEARSVRELLAARTAEIDRLRHFETECRISGRALDEREKELAGERDNCARLKRFETECLAKSRALEEREKELAGERDKCAELRRLLAETREMLDEERRLRADDEKEIRNIMNYDGTADSQEALDEK